MLIKLSNCDKFVQIDDEDFIKIKEYIWFIDNYGYARTSKKNKDIRMHRLILDEPKDKHVDHINLNKLDNRKENLRLTTNQGNNRNKLKYSFKNKPPSSNYKGVYWNKAKNKWKAQICFNYKNIHLGYFSEEVKAAQAYDLASIYYFGEYARTNF